MRDPDTTPPYSATGNGIAILANRISHAFDFAGTSQTIDTGCSASMIAVHQACKSLLSKESDIVSRYMCHIIYPDKQPVLSQHFILTPAGNSSRGRLNLLAKHFGTHGQSQYSRL